MKANKGITPQEVIDKYDGIIRKSFIDFEFHLIITLELRL
jgi:methionyl-tRNA synthetase